MGFTIEVGEVIVPTASTWNTGNDSAHYTYFVCVSNPCDIGVALTDISALVLLEVANAKYKFATFSVSGASWVLESIETSWHTSTSTVKQVVSVSSGSLACAAGDYIGIVFEVPANTDLMDGIGYADLSGDLLNDLNTSYITSGTGTSASWRTYIYGYGEYNHNNTSTIPQTSQSTGALSIDELYTGYGAIRLTDIDCVGTYSALFEMQSPWGETDNAGILESGQSETMSRGITGGTEYYKVTVTNINCVANTVTFTEQWWSDDGNRYVKTDGSDSAMGTTWDVAWLTMGYGFQNIPSGKDLYVEEGLYGGETLSNLDPPQTMKMYIQPSGHTEARCDVIIPTTTGLTNGSFETDGDWYNFYKNVIWTHGRTTEWSDNGSYSYKFYYSGALTAGDYSKISQYIHLNNDTLTGKVRWHTMAGSTCKLSITYLGDIIWSKIMNIGNPVPPEIESFSIDVSTYNSSYGVLDLKIECISGGNSNWTCWWDNLALTA